MMRERLRQFNRFDYKGATPLVAKANPQLSKAPPCNQIPPVSRPLLGRLHAIEPPPLEHNPQNVPASSGRSLFFAISALLSVNFTPGHEDFCSSPSAPIFRVFCVFRGFNSPVFFVPFRAFLWLSIPLLCASAPERGQFGKGLVRGFGIFSSRFRPSLLHFHVKI